MIEKIKYLTRQRDAIFSDRVTALFVKDSASAEKLTAQLKAVSKELTALKKAQEAQEPVFDAQMSIENMKFRQWRETAKIRVYFLDDRQYPVSSAYHYFTSSADAQTHRDDEFAAQEEGPWKFKSNYEYINSTLIPVNCETVSEMENLGRVNIRAIYENEVK